MKVAIQFLNTLASNATTGIYYCMPNVTPERNILYIFGILVDITEIAKFIQAVMVGACDGWLDFCPAT